MMGDAWADISLEDKIVALALVEKGIAERAAPIKVLVWVWPRQGAAADSLSEQVRHACSATYAQPNPSLFVAEATRAIALLIAAVEDCCNEHSDLTLPSLL